MLILFMLAPVIRTCFEKCTIHQQDRRPAPDSRASDGEVPLPEDPRAVQLWRRLQGRPARKPRLQRRAMTPADPGWDIHAK